MRRTQVLASHDTDAVFPLAATTTKRFLLLVAVDLVVLAVLVTILRSSGHTGPHLALIPTLIVLTAKKFFGSKKDEDLAFGDHPAVRFTFEALATGELANVHKMVAADFLGYANGYPVVDSHGADGPAQFAENIEYWRTVVPDLSVDIYDETSQKDPDKTDTIAVRFVLNGTLTTEDHGREFEVEGAAFIKVVDHMLSEWRIVVDTSFLDHLRTAMGHPLP